MSPKKSLSVWEYRGFNIKKVSERVACAYASSYNYSEHKKILICHAVEDCMREDAYNTAVAPPFGTFIKEYLEMLSPYHAKYYGYDLTRRRVSGMDRLSSALFDAALFALQSRFVEDLKAFYDANPDYFAHQELYLLRNLSKGRGVGFFEAGNFHPDFIIWQVLDGHQRVTFVDPKGIHNVGLQDPKIGFLRR